MRSHLCNKTVDWRLGTVAECGCGNRFGRAQLNRTGYENKTRMRQSDMPPDTETTVAHRDHYSGRIDATVRPETIKMKVVRV